MNVIVDRLAWFKNKRVVAVYRPNHVDDCWPEWDQETISIFQHQIGNHIHAVRAGLYLEHDASGGLELPELIQQTALSLLRLAFRQGFFAGQISLRPGIALNGFVQVVDIFIKPPLLVFPGGVTRELRAIQVRLRRNPSGTLDHVTQRLSRIDLIDAGRVEL